MQGGQQPSPLSLSGLTQLLSQTQQALAAGLTSPCPLHAGEPPGKALPSLEGTQGPASQPSGSSVFLQAAPQPPMPCVMAKKHHSPLVHSGKPPLEPRPASALQQPWPNTQSSPDTGIASAAQPSSAPQRAQQQQSDADAALAWQQGQQQQFWQQAGFQQALAVGPSKTQAYTGVPQQHLQRLDHQDREHQAACRAATDEAPGAPGVRRPQGGEPVGAQAVSGGGLGAGAQQGAGVPKERMRWTQELHSRFVRAVGMLGGAAKAKPKDIMDVMRVPGLGLNHIKSHLQKYRGCEGQVADAQTPTGASSASVYKQHPMPGGSLAGHKRVWQEESPNSPAVQSKAPPPHAAAAVAAASAAGPAQVMVMAPPPAPPPSAAKPAMEAGRAPAGPGALHASHAVAAELRPPAHPPLPDPPQLPPNSAQQQQEQQQQVSALQGGELAASWAAALASAAGQGGGLQQQLSQVMLCLGAQAPSAAAPGALGGGAAAGEAALGLSPALAGQAGPQAQGSSPSWQQTQHGKQAQQPRRPAGGGPAERDMRPPASPRGGGSLLDLLQAAMVLQHTAVQHLQVVATLQGDLRGKLQRQIQLEREFDEQLGLHIRAVQTLMAHCLAPLVSHLSALSRACARVVGAAEAQAQAQAQAHKRGPAHGGAARVQADGHDKRQRQAAMGEVREQAAMAADGAGNSSWGALQQATQQAVQQAAQRGHGPREDEEWRAQGQAQGPWGQALQRVAGPGVGGPASRCSPRPSSDSLSPEGATYFPFPAPPAAAPADPPAAVTTGHTWPAAPSRPTAHRGAPAAAASIAGRTAARHAAAIPPSVPAGQGAEPVG
ncbi:hypothetical protein N2152v2_003769 [Parachlorella kessleri]